MNIFKNIVISVFGLILASGASASIITWDFNLPAAATQHTAPYPSLGTLTLEDITGGVKFTLDPNENNPGYFKTQGQTVNISHIIGVDFVYAGSATPSFTLGTETGTNGATQSSPPTIASFNYEMNTTMDSGYIAADEHINMVWLESDAERFLVDQISIWEILGPTVADFAGTSASHSSSGYPQPTAAILHVSAFNNAPVEVPNPSKWVVGVAGVPEPGILALMALGLAGIGFSRKYKS